MFRVYIASVEANVRAEQRRREAFEKAVLSWQAYLSTSGQAMPSRRGHWQLILSRLTALRAREEEDREILEDLEQLLQDA